MSNSDGSPSALRTPTLSTPQWTKATVRGMRGQQFEQGGDAVVLDGIAMHRRKKAER